MLVGKKIIMLVYLILDIDTISFKCDIVSLLKVFIFIVRNIMASI